MTDKTYELKVNLSGRDEERRELLRAALRENGFAQFAESCPDYKEHNPEYAVEGSLVEQDLSRLSIYSFARDELEKAQAVVVGIGGFSCEISAIDTTVWQEGWKQSFAPLLAGKFYVNAPWHTSQAPDKSIPICIDPGMAFGTGQHATTHLCLELLSSIAIEDLRGPVLDCGSGSGILSIAASKLGAGEISATDIEADALIAIVENCKRNGVEGVAVSRESVPAGSYGLVMANILTPVLLKLLPAFSQSLGSGAKILFSGILEEQKADFLEETGQHEIYEKSSLVKDGWLGLLMEKK